MPKPEFRPVNGKPGWYRANVGSDYLKVEAMAKELNRSRLAHTYFVCGLREEDSPHMLYRVETSNPLEIVKEFKVGSHCDYIPDIGTKVLQELAMVHGRNPLIPYFADPAAFKCAFEHALTDDFAEFLDATVNEGLEIYAGADGGEFGSVVVKDGFLHLWWD
jgi:hypothetical protein